MHPQPLNSHHSDEEPAFPKWLKSVKITHPHFWGEPKRISFQTLYQPCLNLSLSSNLISEDMIVFLGRESLLIWSSCRLPPWDCAGVCIPVRARRLQFGVCVLCPPIWLQGHRITGGPARRQFDVWPQKESRLAHLSQVRCLIFHFTSLSVYFLNNDLLICKYLQNDVIVFMCYSHYSLRKLRWCWFETGWECSLIHNMSQCITTTP